MFKKKVYVWGNWNARAGYNGPTAITSRQSHRDKVAKIEKLDLKNVATWHLRPIDANDSFVMSSCREIDEAELFIALLDAPRVADELNFNALAMMAYAAGQGKETFVVTSKGNRLFDIEFMYHEKFTCFDTLDDLLLHIRPPKPPREYVVAEADFIAGEVKKAATERKPHITVMKCPNNPQNLTDLRAIEEELTTRGYKASVEVECPNYPRQYPQTLGIFVWIRGGVPAK